MTVTRNQKNLALPETTNPSSPDLPRKLDLLRKEATFRDKNLTEEMAEMWKEVLDGYSLPELEYAFDHHKRNANFFIRPGDLKVIVQMYRDTNRLMHKPPRYENHGMGYGVDDAKALWKIVEDEMEAIGGRRMTRGEVLGCVDKLDKLTGRG